MSNGKYNVTLIHQVKQSVREWKDQTPTDTTPVQDSSGRSGRRSGRSHANGNAVPSKRKKLPASSVGETCSQAGPANNTISPPKILTARKRTKNGILKAPTELWLV